MKTPKYIIRTEVSWRLRIRYQTRKVIDKKYNFKKYGGIKHALYAAIEMRNRLLKEYGMIEYLGRKKSPDLQTTRKSQPCIGVYRAYHILNGKTFYNWTAHSHKDGKQFKSHFAVNEYGEECAFLYACGERFRQSGKLIVVNKKALPCKPDVPYIVKG